MGLEKTHTRMSCYALQYYVEEGVLSQRERFLDRLTHQKHNTQYMEKIPAACAMEWSIELDKALRSKTPGRSVEAILLLGQRLELWNSQPEPTMSMYNMFNLVPGEEKTFLNTILLRLADAFTRGDTDVKLAVLSTFRRLYKSSRRKGKNGKRIGVLSKPRISNCDELLRRVKVVYDSGDGESRAMALLLFGYWAEFAKDSAHVRYLILSSMVSSDVKEVKASLLAAGCFCELSNDFAAVVLEMLVNMMSSSDVPSSMKLEGVHALSRMKCSYPIAHAAYKTGLKFLEESTNEDFVVAMLVSLSKIACASSLLIFEQVELLLSHINDRRSITVQKVSLRCLYCIFRKGVCHIPEGACMKLLTRVADNPKLPLAMQCVALRILHQISCNLLPISSLDVLDPAGLLTVIKIASQHSIKLKGLLAIHLLAKLTTISSVNTNMESDGFFSSLPQQVASLIIERVLSLFGQSSDLLHSDSKMSSEVDTLFNLLLHVICKHPDVCCLVLDKTSLLIKSLVDENENKICARKVMPVNEISEHEEEGCTSMRSKLLVAVCKFLVDCFDNLNEACAPMYEILQKVKVLVYYICQCNSFAFSTITVHLSKLHCQIIWYCMLKEEELVKDGSGFLYGCLFDHEKSSLECAEKLLNAKNYWLAYRAATYAACHGAWSMASFIFRNLMERVKTDPSYCWLKSLAQFSVVEMKTQLLLLPNQGSKSKCLDHCKISVMLFGDKIGEIGEGAIDAHDMLAIGKELSRASCCLDISCKTLSSSSGSSQSFLFQNWFLLLRAKLLEFVVEIIEAVPAVFHKEGCTGNTVGTNISVLEWKKSLQKLTQISSKLQMLSEEYDLIAASFVDIDKRSLKVISALALSSSLLAFCAGFPLFIPNIPVSENPASSQQYYRNFLGGILIQDLFRHLRHLDLQVCASLTSILDGMACPQRCFRLQNRLLDTACETKEVVAVCRNAISGILNLQNQACGMHQDEILFATAKDGQKLVLDIVRRWIHVPFQAPKYFFQMRHSMGSEIFISNADTRHPNHLLISRGSCLSLNLCLQLKNMPPNLPIRPVKLYCIISCQASSQLLGSGAIHKCSSQSGFLPWETRDICRLNDELYNYVMNCVKEADGKHVNDKSKGGNAQAYARFEENERGQGFSTCLLDVSRFPVGSYRIRWHSCVIDSQSCYWSLLPLNGGPVVTIQ